MPMVMWEGRYSSQDEAGEAPMSSLNWLLTLRAGKPLHSRKSFTAKLFLCGPKEHQQSKGLGSVASGF